MPCRAPLRSVFLLLLLQLSSARAADAESSPHLPAPKDVMVYSFNFNSSLRWSPVKVDGGSVLYTVHFKTGGYNHWDELNCTHIPQTECTFPWSLRKRRWTFFLRVRAELGQMTSEWVETGPFVAERDTTIGPPKVNSVTESSDSLLVSISPPFPSEASDYFQFNVFYWENATSTTQKEMKTGDTLFKITHLKESTLYCFGIQAELTHSNGQLLGLQSAPECYSTTISEGTRAGYIILIFVVVLFFVHLVTVGLFLLWKHHETIKYWTQPPLEIPSHFKEYLKDPSMPVLEVLDNYAEDEPHDTLSVSFVRKGSQTSNTSLEGQVHSQSISSDSEVT